jgi:hypothetical protein
LSIFERFLFLAGPEGLSRKNFKIWTQSPLKSAARAAELGTVYALELYEFEFYLAEIVRLWRYSSYDVN